MNDWGVITCLRSQTNGALFVLAFLLNLVIGFFDYVTGYDVAVSVFYLAPVGLVVWFSTKEKGAGIAMALITSVTILMSDLLAGKIVRSYPVEVWNTLVHFAIFGISALLLYEVKINIQRRDRLIAELQQALDEVKTLSGLLPMCSSCKKIRDDEGYWNRVDVYISRHSQAMITHSLCPDCARRLYPDVYPKIVGLE